MWMPNFAPKSIGWNFDTADRISVVSEDESVQLFTEIFSECQLASYKNIPGRSAVIEIEVSNHWKRGTPACFLDVCKWICTCLKMAKTSQSNKDKMSPRRPYWVIACSNICQKGLQFYFLKKDLVVVYWATLKGWLKIG